MKKEQVLQVIAEKITVPGKNFENLSLVKLCLARMPPVRSLNKTLRALVPDLISILSNAGKISRTNDQVTWLYSSIPIDKEVLRVILDAWVRTEFIKVPEDELQIVCQELSLEELNWQKKTLNLAEWKQEPNGTARLTGDLYTVLPDFFASLLSSPGVTLCRGPEILRFIGFSVRH